MNTDTTTETAAVVLPENLGLNLNDAGRLILEITEVMESVGMPLHGSHAERMEQLRHIMRAGVKTVQNEQRTATLEKAAWDSVKARQDRRPTTCRDLRHYVRRILRVEGAGQLTLRGMTVADCRRILNNAFGNSKSSFVKGRAVLSSILNFGIRNEWCDTNPVSRIEIPRVQEKPIHPLAPSEAKQLFTTARRPEFRDMRFSLALLLFCGIRPTEVSRLQPSDILWKEGIVSIRPMRSKTGGGRHVPLRGIRNLKPEECIIPRNWNRRWQQLRRAAGFTEWAPDVCRHTFASYHAAKHRNLPALQVEMGHRDTALLRTRYIMPAIASAATEFWQLCV